MNLRDPSVAPCPVCTYFFFGKTCILPQENGVLEIHHWMHATVLDVQKALFTLLNWNISLCVYEWLNDIIERQNTHDCGRDVLFMPDACWLLAHLLSSWIGMKYNNNPKGLDFTLWTFDKFRASHPLPPVAIDWVNHRMKLGMAVSGDGGEGEPQPVDKLILPASSLRRSSQLVGREVSLTLNGLRQCLHRGKELLFETKCIFIISILYQAPIFMHTEFVAFWYPPETSL